MLAYIGGAMFIFEYKNNDLDKVYRHTVDLFDHMDRIFSDVTFKHGVNNTFPPHNIRRKDNQYLIEMAIAGFQKDEIQISKEKDYLVVTGKKESKSEDHMVYQGIAHRDFKKSFALGDRMKVLGAEVKDGMLYIALEQEVPEEEKPQSVEIGTGLHKKSKLLT
jgi:molecular chaperone IbpA